MRSVRTDLAFEARAAAVNGDFDDDIISCDLDVDGFSVNKLTIGEKAAKGLGKPRGEYYSAEFGKLWNEGSEELQKTASMIAKLLDMACPEREGCVLVACLGNSRITPDSVGPKCAKKITVTRHIRLLDKSLYQSLGVGECACVATGVLGDTGVESAGIVKGVADSVKPCCIIAIDALSAREMKRMGTTVQVSNSGIMPGSGVNNCRAEISESTMGCPVVSLGFPTVVDGRTLALDMLEDAGVNQALMEKAEYALSNSGHKSFFVCPKDCDAVTDCLSDIASMAVNIFVHGENISLD